MTEYVALLRAVNLAGKGRVAMQDLRALAEELGFKEPRTLLQSGNLLFRSSTRSGPRLEETLAEAARGRLGLDTAFLVRSAAEWRDAVGRNPFPQTAENDPAHLLMVVLEEAPDPVAATDLEEGWPGPETLRVLGQEAFAVYPKGIGRSRLTMALIERRLGTRGTGRNWNTVRKIAEKLGG